MEPLVKATVPSAKYVASAWSGKRKQGVLVGLLSALGAVTRLMSAWVRASA